MPKSAMLSVSEAQSLILAATSPLPPCAIPLREAVGLVLAEDAVSDLDAPPFDKAMMDGYAVRASDAAESGAELTVIEEVTAGRTPTLPLGPGQATRIMTGAPLPAGADAVVMIERTRLLGPGRVRLDTVVKPEQNVLRRATEMRRGEVVLAAGTQLRPQEIGVLALVGRATPLCHPRPRVAIVPTGDEIVEPHEQPGPGQIRNSNGPMLLAQVQRAGAFGRLLATARDTEASLREQVSLGLQDDVLILSGGVSAGKLDLVPEVLARSGVRIEFHKVEMKPGKPMLFGVKERGNASPPTLVFGLPGNPVSGYVCFELFVRPALRRLRNVPPGPSLVQATLTVDHPHRTDRPTYHPARLTVGDRGWEAQATPWFGSADLRGLTAANALLVLPPGDHHHTAGTLVPVLRVETED
ncbi:MAG: molybdopterin molybdotransferase MoeA [Gemmataceae bacterium]|nr:molybdopterin molybdotransferase MoeA [Gemmataceae bacterium]